MAEASIRDRFSAFKKAQAAAAVEEGTPGPVQSTKGDLARRPTVAPATDLVEPPEGIDRDPGALGAGVISAADAAFFGLTDEATGLIEATVKKLGGDPRAFWDNYKETLEGARATLATARERHPVASTVGSVAGALATVPLGPAQVVRAGGNLGTRALRAAGVGAVVGGAYGAGSANPEEESVSARLAGAGEGATIGAPMGAAGVPIARGAGRLVTSIRRRAADFTGSRDLGVKRRAFTKVRDAAAEDAATGTARAPTEGDMVMNLGPSVESAAEGIATQPGPGANILLRESRNQADAEGGRVAALIDRTLGRDRGRVTNAADVEAERKAAGRMYDVARAHATPIEIAPARDALERAIAESDGSIRGQLEGLRRLRLFNPTSGDRFNRMPADFHAARIELDDLMRSAGAGTNASRLLGRVRSAIDDTLKNGVPGYRAADRAYSEVLAGRDALEAGRGVFSRSFGSPDELAAELQAMAPSVRARFVAGARDAISALMGSARNDAGAVTRELLDKGWNREKLAILVGPDTARVIGNNLEGVANRQRGRNNLSAGSRTAMRQAAQKRFPGDIDKTEVNQRLRQTNLTGVGLQALVSLANSLSGGIVTRAVNAARQRTNAGAARLLSASGQQRDRVLTVLAEAEARVGRALNAEEQIEAVTRAFSAPATVKAIEARQGNRQPLEITVDPPFRRDPAGRPVMLPAR